MARIYVKVRRAFGLGAWIAFVCSVSIGCASTSRTVPRFDVATTGYSVPNPNQLPATGDIYWRSVNVSDCDLAFRGPQHAFIAVSSHCGEPEESPSVLGRQLLVGIKNRSVISTEEFAFAGGAAFSQVVEAKSRADSEEPAVRTKTVTLVRGGCVVDWVLADGSLDPNIEATFDQWWRGFDPGSMPSLKVSVAEGAP
jgi:hypothetical protein